MQRSGRRGLGILELCRSKAWREQRQNGALGFLGVDAGVAVHAILDAFNKCTSVS